MHEDKIDKSNRRQARELALQVLFQMEFVADIPIESRLDYFRNHLDIPQGAWQYAQELLTAYETHKVDIDSQLSAISKNWKISRMASVDLCLLRIAALEILYRQNDVPPKVAIDEAIEIAKRYGNTDSSAFINGILDELLRSQNLKD